MSLWSILSQIDTVWVERHGLLLFLDHCFPQYWIYTFFFFGTNVQYNWPCFGEICFIANALWVMWHLVSNQDSIFFREHIVQTKNSLFEKVQKPGHFVIDKHKGNLLTYCCLKNYFTFAFFPPPLFFNLHEFLWSFHFKWMFSAWFPSEPFSTTSISTDL